MIRACLDLAMMVAALSRSPPLLPRSAAQLEEDDSIWEFEGLLQAVTQEFNAQMRGPSESHQAKKRTFDRRGGGGESGSVGNGNGDDGFDDDGGRAAPFDEGGAMLSRSRTARALLA